MKKTIQFCYALSFLFFFLCTTVAYSQFITQNSGTSERLWEVDFIDANTGWAVGDNGTILTTADGGDTWNAQNSGTNQALYDVDFVDASNGWIAGNATILATTDGGANWIAQNPGTGQALRDVTFVDASNGWVTGFGSTILHTTDGGATWTPQTPGNGIVHIYASVAADANTAWYGGIGAFLTNTTDAGTNWLDQTSTMANTIYALEAIDANTAWMGGAGGTPRLWRTTDGGANWGETAVSGVTGGLQYWDIVFMNANVGIASAYLGGGLAYTEDGGATWTHQGTAGGSVGAGAAFVDGIAWQVGANGEIAKWLSPVATIPTMGEWALIIFGLVILSMAMVYVMRWTAQNQRIQVQNGIA